MLSDNSSLASLQKFNAKKSILWALTPHFCQFTKIITIQESKITKFGPKNTFSLNLLISKKNSVSTTNLEYLTEKRS